mmetsp:Transcript_7327/g.11535  ORF Transcript_7327/g.11535 Transcript_7327/m.11535 type:complete len:136 (-) Transcript_7327:1388-1795(-)
MQYTGDRIKRTIHVNETLIDKTCSRFLNPEGHPVKKRVLEELTESLEWDTHNTKSDMCYTVQELSRQLQDPTPKHMKSANRCLQYLKGPRELGITYSKPDLIDRQKGYSTDISKSKTPPTVGFNDRNFAMKPDDS